MSQDGLGGDDFLAAGMGGDGMWGGYMDNKTGTWDQGG